MKFTLYRKRINSYEKNLNNDHSIIFVLKSDNKLKYTKRDLFHDVIPFIPLLLVLILLLIKPYYILPTIGDTDFHLVRAREILQNPIHGLFWDYLVYSPNGRALWHPPLFHSIFGFLWYVGGVRFAHSILCIFQILLTVFVATWVAKKDYGNLAGFFAGLLSLSANRIDNLTVPIPAAYIPILAVLTIHYLPKEKFKAFLTALIGIWTHMIGLVIFIALFIVDGFKDRKNLKMSLLLLPSLLFWALYWFIFKNQTGATNHIHPVFYFPPGNNLSGLLILICFGLIGLCILYKNNREVFKLYATYMLLVIIIESLFEDFARGFQYASLPLAVLSGLTIQKLYNFTQTKYKKNFSRSLIILVLICSIIGSSPFFISLYSDNTDWSYLDVPFESKYSSINQYINQNTSKNDVLWAETSISDKIAWMTGRYVSNGKYGCPKYFVEEHQKINIYVSNDSFLIKDYNNNTLNEIPF